MSASDNTTWKLGDIINSTPKIASRVPLNTYDRTYGDTTYRDFTRSSVYLNRGMVFVGANDGMLHAFKLGKLEFPGDNTWTTPGANDKVRLRNLDTSVPLGQERWAFIPKNALPYLKAMLDNNYCHLYYVDQASQLFDASIGPPAGFVADNATRTSASWRTILIGGMRFGGACAVPSSGRTNAVDLPVSGIGYSSYFAIDVTNPESPIGPLGVLRPRSRVLDHGTGDRPGQRRGPHKEREMVRGLRFRADRADLEPAVLREVRPDAETVRRRPQDRGSGSGRSSRGTAPAPSSQTLSLGR